MFDLDKIRQMRKAGFGSERATADMKIDLIVNDLASIEEDMVKNHLPKISESLFVNKYLMAFAGVGADVVDNHATYLEWMTDVAGNFNIKVHVCDDRTKQVLFTVPAISNVQTIKPDKAETKEIRRAITMAEEARFLQPHNWEAILKNGLHGVLRKLYNKDNPINSEEQQVWLSIFKRYEHLLIGKQRIEVTPALAIKDGTDTKPNTTSPPVQTYDEVDDPI